MKSVLVSLVLVVVCRSPEVHAQAPGNQSPRAPVSAGRIDIDVTAKAPAGTSTLSGETLRELDRPDLGQAVELLPGVAMRRVGPRNETALYMRGFDLRQVPLYIDGFPVYVPYDGHVDLSRFLTADVSEIRVSKGIASVLYGPNTLGGAINVISSEPDARFKSTVHAQIGAGEDHMFDAMIGTRQRVWWGVASAAHRRADMFRLPGGGERINAHRQDDRLGLRAGYSRAAVQTTVAFAAQRGEKGSPPYGGPDATVRIRYWQWPRWDKDNIWAVATYSMGRAGYLRGCAWRDTFDNALHSYDDAT